MQNNIQWDISAIIGKGKKTKLKFNGTYNITYIGRLVQEKGVSLLIDAFSQIINEYDAKLMIIGDGNYRSSLEEQVKKKNICN